MRLVQFQARNFKLIEDITINFSTDPDRPLTVIRAENGSGKTSLLYALLWVFYGKDGLGDQGDLRLTSTALPIGESADVEVRVKFDHEDSEGTLVRYQAIRTITESPIEGDKVKRSNPRFQLVRFVDTGHENVPEELIDKLVPQRLQDIFFTNGDDVQKFISGRLSNQRQKQVHTTIEALLGLNEWRETVKDLEWCQAAIRKKTAKETGTELVEAEEEHTRTIDQISEVERERETIEKLINRMTQHRDKDDRELTSLRGSGDLDKLNEEISDLELDLGHAERELESTLAAMVDLIRSEKISWYFLNDRLCDAVDKLNDLRDRNIIPGTSIQVLVDRLEIGICICGEELVADSNRRSCVESLLQEQRQVDENRQRLSRLSYLASESQTTHEHQNENEERFAGCRIALLESLTSVRDTIRGKRERLNNLRKKRKLIDADQVRTLATRIDDLDKKIGDQRESLGGVSAKLEMLSEREADQQKRYEKAVAASKITKSRKIESDMITDLLTLARNTLSTLEMDYVYRVSTRMQTLFLEIVGSDPFSDGTVFKGARVGEDFNIVIESHNDRTLDPDFELNGASQRALTLAFIWAAMQVADVTAPRIIDTPLGMVAGGVKSRMVEAITRPAKSSDPSFQVVLLLTRSEIRDVEDLLDKRAGMLQTLSCSKDFPADLINDWNVDSPVIRSCTCDHRSSCHICARVYDRQHGIHLKTEEV